MPALATKFTLKPQRTISALAASAVLSAVVAFPLLSSPAAHAGVTQTPGLVAGKTLSGMINHQGPTYANAFGTWRKAPITAVTVYTAVDSWANITAMGSIGYWSGINVHHVWSMPLIPEDGSSTLEKAAAGSYDAKYVTVAQKLVAGGDGNATMRLGWEFSGDWFGWNGVKDPAAFAGAFRHAVTAMRSVAGAHFTFDWDPALLQADPTNMWPGDAYVDIVSADTYDTSYASGYPASNHTAVWNQIMTGKFGWNWLINFAQAHGNKRLAIPEWGVRYMCDGHGGGDDPNFIDQIRTFVNTHDVAFETYFDANDNSCSRFMIRGGDFPKASAEYQKLFSTAGQTPVTPPTTAPPTTTPPTTVPSTTTPPTTTPPTTTPPTTTPPSTTPPTTAPPTTPVGASTGSALQFSYSPDLSWPAALDKQSIDHNIYPYYPSISGVKKVVFSLDGATVNTDSAAPWAFVGATPALNPTKLSVGTHTVVASVTMSNGVTVTASAAFTVPSGTGTSAAPAPGAALQFSYSPDLSWPAALDKLSADHNIYPFYPSSSSVKKVVWALDGATVNTDTAAPFALTGATPALDPQLLTKGAHTLTATVTTSTGATLKSSSTITVPNGVGK
ncbi:hypothetical protein acdb102_18200 [Acidothermaceae bacterium B102]|nr:hypothetical protein acdb102_18200 [Acidothermaceae bacterium B102]